MEYVTLNNGVKMPILGYGVYQTPPADTESCVSSAIKLGYRRKENYCLIREFLPAEKK